VSWRFFLELLASRVRVEDFVAVRELERLYEGGAVECRKALRGLRLLVEYRAPSELVNELDRALAEAMRSGRCAD